VSPRPATPDARLPLSDAALHILLAVAEEDRHGYSIMQEVAARTGGKLRLGPGTLYGCLKRLLADGLIEESSRRPAPVRDDPRRRYYRLTSLGRRVAAAELDRLAALLKAARRAKLGRTLPALGSR
jgi:DNA-binding PadR family transcriptional regulator